VTGSNCSIAWRRLLQYERSSRNNGRQGSDQAQRIGSIISLIHDIASQTNLLALNATI
jgi:methyl-accepting chemotaxis protein